jgi:hypothetical protein
MIWGDPNTYNFAQNQVFPTSFRDVPWTFCYLYNWMYVLSPEGTSWTVALSLLALRRPRPEICHLANQPGIAGCWAASITLAISCGLSALNSYRLGHFEWELLARVRRVEFSSDVTIPDLFVYIFSDSFRPIGCSVCSIWAMAALGKRWSPGANWLDRTGLVLGIAWVAFMILQIVEQML